jgi:hypothetical protein
MRTIKLTSVIGAAGIAIALVSTTASAGLMNAFNRVAISFRVPPLTAAE